MKRIFAYGAAACGALTLLAIGVPSMASTSHPYRHEVNGRLENQDDRVQNGLKNHDLNKEQAYHLDALDSRVRTQEDRDLSRNNGHLTTREYVGLNHELNRDSRDIYRAKH